MQKSSTNLRIVRRLFHLLRCVGGFFEESRNGVFNTGPAVTTDAKRLENVFWIIGISGSHSFLDLFFGDAFTDTDVHKTCLA